jgi:hypothetical protein
MTRRASFGDFAADATQHLQQLRWLRRPSDVTDRAIAPDVVADLIHAVHALAGLAEDACRALDAEYLAGDRQLGVWIRAATQAREALATAETALSATHGLEDGASADRRRWGSGHLRAAARSMTLGRDLLHTYDAMHAGRMTVARSEWTPVVSSAPVACAILHETGGWARQIAEYAYPLSATATCPAPEGRTLSTVGKALSQVSWAIGEAGERRPVRHNHVTLLHTIPVNTSPAACLPTGLELVADLEVGVISTAERLRFAVRGSPHLIGSVLVAPADQGNTSADSGLLCDQRLQHADHAAHSRRTARQGQCPAEWFDRRSGGGCQPVACSLAGRRGILELD